MQHHGEGGASLKSCSAKRGLSVMAAAFAMGCAPVAPPPPLWAVAKTAVVDGPPDLPNGVYVMEGSSNCQDDWCWRLCAGYEPIVLRQQPNDDADIAVTVPSGEWILDLGGKENLIPRRGVVKTPQRLEHPIPGTDIRPVLAQGDVVYRLGDLGMGLVAIWRRGQEMVWDPGNLNNPETDQWTSSDGSSIVWDPPPQTPPRGVLGQWDNYQRKNGESGWTRPVASLTCPEPRDDPAYVAAERILLPHVAAARDKR